MAYDVPSGRSSSSSFPSGEPIRVQDGRLSVPDFPIIPFLEGDGTGPEIWRAARKVLDAAVRTAYGDRRRIVWKEVLAGEKALREVGRYLPEETLAAIAEHVVAIKGPLTTPVGEGFRSLNVALRQLLDLYACVRPVRHFPGVPSPLVRPERVNTVIFRENTEDVYAGLEWAAGSSEAEALLRFLGERLGVDPARFAVGTTAFGLKPISERRSKRLVRAAIRYALEYGRKSVTLVHKGNIMKFTEGGFRRWGYDVAEEEFGERVFTWREYERVKAEKGEAAAEELLAEAKASGRLIVKEAIADNAFQQLILRPEEMDVLATTNLNGDYLSDAAAALAGGLGMAPGANINYETGHAVFEATHGTAPKYAGKDVVNPSSVILSGEMMLRYLGWHEAADVLLRAMERTLAARIVTQDLGRHMDHATVVGTQAFGDALVRHMEGG
ncbi:MAG: Isocitrate dehydrogenase [NADP] [Brockia lithotrophica]|uniref:Isocitrate dehydrogenase [NADP] n=1 Tax=Brockia lithotrophica TaxID=933949 RepID=A0A2T5GAF6_9BACL|nr:MAG: Isocitrate dehydrogenase [NADP] [Brockia lithotrophica]